MPPLGRIQAPRTISPVPAVTILGTAHFSRSHWKLDKDEAGLKLWQAARQWIQPEALALDVHRWRFAQVPEPLEQSHAQPNTPSPPPVSYTHLRAYETKANLVCRPLLENKKDTIALCVRLTLMDI